VVLKSSAKSGCGNAAVLAVKLRAIPPALDAQKHHGTKATEFS
jgi:hypothetical protein